MQSITVNKYKILLFLLFFCGCAKADNYVGATHGYFTVGMKQGFGEGGEKKKFYALDDMDLIIPGALKQSVRNKIGLPDKIEMNNEGYEIWIYEERNIKLFFEGEKFKEWAYLK